MLGGYYHEHRAVIMYAGVRTFVACELCRVAEVAAVLFALDLPCARAGAGAGLAASLGSLSLK